MQALSRSETPDRFDDLGKITWLWMNSPLHSEWVVQLAARFLLPAIESGQFHLLERDGMPVAYCSWAWLSAEAELAYMIDPSSVLGDDWHSGNRLWFIDWVAPFGATDSWNLRRAMMGRFPHEVARAIRVRRDRSKARVMEFKGPQLESAQAQARLKNYYENVLSVARQGRPSASITARPLSVATNKEEIDHA